MKIIYFVNKKTFLTKMSRVRFHGIKSLEKIAEVKYWGIGWEGYNNNENVQQNLDNLDVKYHIAIVYKPFELKEFNKINIPKCIRYNEMYDINWTLKEIQGSGCKLVICHHLNDCLKYQKMKIEDVKFIYIGHCAEESIFKNYNLPYEYDILIAGCLSSHYPLRNRFIKLLPKLNKKYKCHKHQHPGYDLNDAHTDKYLMEMAHKINKSRITLTDTGLPNSRYGKYIEIPMCGTSALCGDIPDKDVSDKNKSKDNYDFVIEVNNNMTDKEIIDKISYYLDNEDKRLEKVERGLQFSKKYTQENYAEKLFKELKKYYDMLNENKIL